jgi:putative MATE family efflux protein
MPLPRSRDKSLSVVNLKRGGLGTILLVAWPVALSTLLTQFMTIVDTFWIGRLGAVALASVGVAGSVFGVLVALSQLVNAPTMAFVARFAGANDRSQAQAALFHGLLLALSTGVVLALAGVPLSRPILGLFGASREVMQVGTPYLAILFVILPLVYFSVCSFTAMQATGDTLSPLLVSAGSNVLNLLLDPLLIFGWLGFPRMGVMGAGIATAIATLFNVIMAVVVLNRKNLLALALPRLSILGRFLKIGFFAMIQGITRPLTGMVMFYIVGLSGVVAQAAFTVGLRIIGIPFIFITGLTVATQSLVGQYLGARKPLAASRIVRLSGLSGFLLQVILSTLLFLAAGWLVGVFAPGQDEVIKVGSAYLRVLAPFLLILPFSMAWSGAQYGAGRTLGPAVASVAANWVVKLPLAFVLSQIVGMDTTGVWLAIGASVVVETAVNGAFFARGAWKRSRLA